MSRTRPDQTERIAERVWEHFASIRRKYGVTVPAFRDAAPLQRRMYLTLAAGLVEEFGFKAWLADQWKAFVARNVITDDPHPDASPFVRPGGTW